MPHFLSAINETLDIMICPSKSAVTTSISLSNSTVPLGVNEMTKDIENKLCETLKNKKFSLQLDESTLRENESF